MKDIIRKLFPKTYWAIWEDSRQSLFRNEFEMQRVKKKYNNLSWITIYEDERGITWKVSFRFTR